MKEFLKLTRILALSLSLVLIIGSLSACGKDPEEIPVDIPTSSEESSSAPYSEESSSEESSSEESSSEAPSSEESSSEAPSSRPTSSSSSSSKPAEPTTGLKPPANSGITPAPIVNIKAPNGTLYNKTGTQQDYKTPMDMEDNIFMDSLIYLGYNVEKQRQDGLMWQYILSAQKKRFHKSSGPYNWLSKISYDYDGGTSGYETDKNGKPDLEFFNKNDMVCASFIGYVYANYLPNVVGIDTSILGKPEDFGWSNVLADSWYEVAKTWVQKGWSEFIKFDCRRVEGSGGMLRITPERSIPIGSLIVTANDSNANTDYAGHVSIYAGWKDGYNWVYHVGNDNGPEFCSIERMGYNPDPHYRQWLVAIITPPNVLNYAPKLEVTVTDAEGNPVKDAAVAIEREKNGQKINLGKTDDNGIAKKDYLYYDGMTVTVTAADGKTSTSKITLTAENNSEHKLNITMN